MKKEEEVQQAFKKLAALCAKGEHCSGEMLNKMRLWGLDEEAQASIMSKLVAGKYIDDDVFKDIVRSIDSNYVDL